MGSPKPKDPGEEFLQKLTWPEEERYLYTTAPWDGGYRWFRSPNVLCLERYRARKQATGGKDDTSPRPWKRGSAPARSGAGRAGWTPTKTSEVAQNQMSRSQLRQAGKQVVR